MGAHTVPFQNFACMFIVRDDEFQELQDRSKQPRNTLHMRFLETATVTLADATGKLRLAGEGWSGTTTILPLREASRHQN